MLSQHYLGLYKTSSALVGQIMGLITAATTPVLFSSLSRLQDEEEEFRNLFFRFQKLVGLLVIPIGVGIFCFSDFITSVLLGNQWMEASGFIGLWGVTSAITIVLSHYCSEIYRSKGRPKLSVLVQWLHIIVLWPVVLVAVKYGFETLYVARSLVRFELILVNLIVTWFLVKISPWDMMKNIYTACIASIIMFFAAKSLQYISNGIIWQIFSIIICATIYICFVIIYPSNRKVLFNLSRKRV